MGEILSQQNCQTPLAEELIVQVEGHPIQHKQKRIEALSAVVDQPDKLREVDQSHRHTDKTCVVSAQEDQLKTIKTDGINTACKQGMAAQTRITRLADAAKHCGSILLTLHSYSQSLESSLDWVHIAQKFHNVQPILAGSFEESLETAKCKLWHASAKKAVAKLALIRENLTDAEKKVNLQGLYSYLKQNHDYLLNYEQCQQANPTLSSTVAESHIDSLMNPRHQKTPKMQWIPKGAHQVLQIPAMMASNQWHRIGTRSVLSALVA